MAIERIFGKKPTDTERGPRRYYVGQITLSVNIHDDSEVKQLGEHGPVVVALNDKFAAGSHDRNDMFANLTEQLDEHLNRLADKKDAEVAK